MAFITQKKILKFPLEHNLGSALCVCVHVCSSSQAAKNGSNSLSAWGVSFGSLFRKINEWGHKCNLTNYIHFCTVHKSEKNRIK